MIKNALFLVPHQDDELNIGGCLFDSLKRKGIKLYILYMTKGNYYKDKYLWRIKERDSVLSFWGINDFKQLDYNDNYRVENHNFYNKTIFSSIKDDVKEYIKECRCELIVCVDYDQHPDHQLLSSVFDIAMRELIIEYDYHPLVLKKFAYFGVWNGYNDFFNLFPKRTCEMNSNYEKYYYSIPNQWDDRICFATNRDDYSLFFWRSKVYKSYKRYFTQCGGRFFFKAVNSDIIYWFRNTKNLMLTASVYSDSGVTSYVNDFCLVNLVGLNEKDSVKRFSSSAWIPKKKNELLISWNKTVKIKTIKLYQNFKSLGHISKFEVVFPNGDSVLFTCNEFDVQYFVFPNFKVTNKIIFRIIEGCGDAGIRELEIYEDSGAFPWEKVPFKKFDENVLYNNTRFIVVFSKIIWGIFWFYLRLKNKFRKVFNVSHW